MKTPPRTVRSGSPPTTDFRTRISPVLLTSSAGLVLLGCTLGRVLGSDTSAPVHDPSANAWGIHLLLTVVAIALSTTVIARFRARHGRYPDFAGPWRTSTYDAIRHTFRRAEPKPDRFDVLRLARTLAVGLSLLIAAYVTVRLGMQIGFVGRPAEYVNAWGGPTYAGAFYAHVLDAALIASPCLLLGRAAAMR